MKLTFEDQSSIEIQKSAAGKVIIIVRAKDVSDKLKVITNTCEITVAQFRSLCAEILGS